MLTETQIRNLAQRLQGRRANVYVEAQSMFGHKVGEEIFDELKKVGVAKCHECDTWKSVGAMSNDDFCLACE